MCLKHFLLSMMIIPQLCFGSENVFSDTYDKWKEAQTEQRNYPNSHTMWWYYQGKIDVCDRILYELTNQ